MASDPVGWLRGHPASTGAESMGDMAERNDWDQLECETPRAYEAFRAYLNLGSGRTLNGAYGATKGRPEGVGRASGNCVRWSRDHRWAERARAWDEYIAAREMEAT